MSENINENKTKENHREYNKTRKYNSRNRKPGDNNTKKPMAKQKNFRYRQQKSNDRHYDKHADRQAAVTAKEITDTQQPKQLPGQFPEITIRCSNRESIPAVDVRVHLS